ncbi:MAG: response regulator transcription factor [Cyclobacteriaceae bacterium]|nr:response regulator transcription factor [Cyclobacteriaceae bacterium HetDA_MAG_MS6]
MKAVLIEDEPIAMDRLLSLVKQLEEPLDIIGQFDTVRESVAFLADRKDDVDVLFCDIQLADGLSFDIFDQVKITNPVIFTTAYDEYSLKAFEINSLDYLLKPVRYKDLSAAIDKYKDIYAKRSFEDSIAQIKELWLNPSPYRNRFLVQMGNKFFQKRVDETTYFHVDNKVVYLYDQSPGRRYVMDFTMEELVEKHLDPKIFFRINRKCIVHVDAIELMRSYPNQRLLLKLKVPHQEELVVSREKVSHFKKWLNG